MRRFRVRAFVISCGLASLLAATPGCGGDSSETFVVVRVNRGTAVGAIDKIDVTLMLGGQSAVRSLTETGGGDITLPTDGVFHILHGEGSLSVRAVAFKGATMVSAGSTAMTISRGGTTTIDVTLGMDTLPGDGGVDGSMDPVLAIAPTSHDFGQVAILGAAQTTTLTVTNSGGATSGALSTAITGASSFTVGTDGCNGMTLAPAASCTVVIAFAPTAAGAAMATLTVSATPGNNASAALMGTGVVPGSLLIAPSTQDFGSVVASMQSPTVNFVVTNPGTTATGALTTALSGADSNQFLITSDGCTGLTLNAAATCSIGVRFTPSTMGPKMATLAVSATPGGAQMATLTGTGLTPGALSLAPMMNNFGPIVTGMMSAEVVFTVTNTGGAASGVPTVMLGDNANFAVTMNGCSAAIPATGMCTVRVRFNPTTTGNKLTSLTVTASPGGTAASSLQGVGLGPAMLTIAPTPRDFGPVTVGGMSSIVTFTVTNMGGGMSGVPSTVLTDTTNFTIAANTCTAVLAPGGTCTVDVRFTPTAPAGNKSASLSVMGSPGGTATAMINGNALSVGAITISPLAQPFGTVVVGGASATFSFTVTNNGGSPTGTPAVTLGDLVNYRLDTNTCTAALPAAGTCLLGVTFLPMSVGSKPTSLSITATPGGTAASSLSGTGSDVTAPATISISASNPVTGAASPSRNVMPTLSGGAGNTEAGASVTLFTASTCMGASSGPYTAAGDGSWSGTAPSAGANGTTTYYAQACDASANCRCGAVGFNYYTDNTPPGSISIVTSAPVTSAAAPSQNRTPTVSGPAGNTEASAAVSVFLTSTCTGTSAGPYTAGAGGGWSGAAPQAAANGTTTYYANACDVAGNCRCSAAAFNYFTDNTAPATISIVTSAPATSAAAPSQNRTPTLSGPAGNTEASAAVTVYMTATCTGTSAGPYTAAAGGSWSGAAPQAAANGTTTYYANACDVAGNCRCSAAAFNYFTDNTAPATISISSSNPATSAAAPSSNRLPTLSGAAGNTEAGAAVTVYMTATCTGTSAGPYTAAGDGSWGGAAPQAAATGTTTYYANACDVAGNCRCSTPAFNYYTTTCATGSATFNYTGAVQTFTVPACVTSIRIDAQGAEGGGGGSPTVATSGGKGARIAGTFTVTGGLAISIMVGKMGDSRPPPGGYNGGGGGGSFVWQTVNQTLLVAAGGGGGAGGLNNTITSEHAGMDAVTTTSGTHGNGLSVGAGTGGGGGVTTGFVTAGAAGAGWNSNGAAGIAFSTGCMPFAVGGTRPLAGGDGGSSSQPSTVTTLGSGGFGGGGGAQGNCGAGGGGGGGGYSGGGGGSSGSSGAAYKGGGGGGSFNGGTAPSNTAGARTGNGTVVITY